MAAIASADSVTPAPATSVDPVSPDAAPSADVPAPGGKILRKRNIAEEVSDKIAGKPSKKGKKETPAEAATSCDKAIDKEAKEGQPAEKSTGKVDEAVKPSPKKSGGGEKVEVVFSFDTTGIDKLQLYVYTVCPNKHGNSVTILN